MPRVSLASRSSRGALDHGRTGVLLCLVLAANTPPTRVPGTATASVPAKVDVLGTGISCTSLAEIPRHLATPPQDRALVINVCNVHSVMSARNDLALAEALAAGDINTPDGIPLIWFMRSIGIADQERLCGFDLTLRIVEAGLESRRRHFFFGATTETLHQLTTGLMRRFPELQIAGSYAPPFRPLTDTETEAVLGAIRDSDADVIWVGLGMPKQEKWMHEMRGHLPGRVLVGIGAAFDFLAGTKPQAPRWMRQNGLEWMFRLSKEPRRLWRRYIFNNPAFLALWMVRVLKR